MEKNKCSLNMKMIRKKQNQGRIWVTAITNLAFLCTRHLYNAQNKIEPGNKEASWTMPKTGFCFCLIRKTRSL